MSTDLLSNDKIEKRDTIWADNELYLRRLCNIKLQSCPQEIDDVMHDTYIALCEAFNDGRVINDYKKWLVGTLNHKVIAKYNEITISKKRFISFDDIETKVFYVVDFDSKRMSDELTEEIADEIISSLSAKEQNLYHLIYDQKLKKKQIASILGIKAGTVRERAFRLNYKIKTIIKEYAENM